MQIVFRVFLSVIWVAPLLCSPPSRADTASEARQQTISAIKSFLHKPVKQRPADWMTPEILGLYRDGCKQRDAFSCYYFAKAIVDKKVPDVTDIAPFFNATTLTELSGQCQAGGAHACFALASASLWGIGVPKSEEKTTAYFTRACELSHPIACFNAASRYQTGKGTQKSLPSAMKFAGKSCDLAVGIGCAMAGMMIQDSDKTEAGLKSAENLYEKACNLGEAAACMSMAKSYSNGFSTRAPSRPKALEFYQKACGFGSQEGCEKAASFGGSGASNSRDNSSDKSKIFDLWKEAVVAINTDASDDGGRGAGFFISEDGVLVTNYHVMARVIESAGAASVTFVLYDGTVAKTFTVGDCQKSTMTDLCILKLPVVPKRSFTVVSELPSKGTTAYQIGHSTQPWIMREGAYLGEYAFQNAGYILTDHPARSGDSGGPIFLADGRVIGVSTFANTNAARIAAVAALTGKTHVDLAMAGREVLKMRQKIRQYRPI